MRTAFLPFVLLLGGGVALGQNPATSGTKGLEQTQQQLATKAALQAQLRSGAEAELRTAQWNLDRAQIPETRSDPAPLTLLPSSRETRRPSLAAPRPIPTRWPDARTELIPTRWPRLKEELVDRVPAQPVNDSPAKPAAATAVRK